MGQGAALAGLCAVCTLFLPSAPIPSSLVGLALATGAGYALNLDVPTLAQKAKDPSTFAGGLSALPQVPEIGVPTLDDLTLAVPVAVSIAFISLLETLLAARFVDEKKCEDLCTFFYDENGDLIPPPGTADGDAPRADVPTETILSLAAGNGLSVLLGGFGGCGLVPQTILNLNSGGGGPISTGSYAICMILFAASSHPSSARSACRRSPESWSQCPWRRSSFSSRSTRRRVPLIRKRMGSSSLQFSRSVRGSATTSISQLASPPASCST